MNYSDVRNSLSIGGREQIYTRTKRLGGPDLLLKYYIWFSQRPGLLSGRSTGPSDV